MTNLMLQTATTESHLRSADTAHDYPEPPWGSARWRLRKECVLSQSAAALRLFNGTRQTLATESSAVGILTYHHVAQHVSSDPFLLNVTPGRFREQLTGLLDRGYQSYSLRDVVACHADNKVIAPKSFVVVFDDGHHSVYENAWPVLRDLRVSATIFLATGFLDHGSPFPFDACQTGLSRCGDARRPLTTLECEEMLASGLIDLGSHTHLHQDYRGRPNEFADDLASSLQLLDERFGLDPVTFSFPYGRFDQAMQDILAEHHVLCGLTAECQLVAVERHRVQDRFGWGRFGATQFDSPRTLAAKLDGWYTWLQQRWRRLRGST